MAVEHGPDGGLREVALFGPRPRRIPAGTPYAVWTYHNTMTEGAPGRGEEWLLYLVEEPGGLRVAEVGSYPPGSVF